MLRSALLSPHCCWRTQEDIKPPLTFKGSGLDVIHVIGGALITEALRSPRLSYCALECDFYYPVDELSQRRFLSPQVAQLEVSEQEDFFESYL